MRTQPVCDCGHHREDHPDRGPCAVWLCRCSYYVGWYPVRTVYLPEEDWHPQGGQDEAPPPAG